jgi:hypothetical protein
MGVPGADDVMLNYQSTSFHDALYLRETLGLRPAPEFERWLVDMGVIEDDGLRLTRERISPLLGGTRALLSGDGKATDMPNPGSTMVGHDGGSP